MTRAYNRKKNGKGKIAEVETPVVLVGVPGGVPEVMKVDELEAARFAALDAELRNHLQSIRIIELEFGKAEQDMKEYVTKFQHEQTQRSGQRKYYQDLVTVKKAEYQDFVQSLGKKYGLDPTQMSIEPESRTIRDLRKDSPS